ncbi:nucleotidyltransferase domain-containing protein [Thermoleptolyngbya sichuanensis XZ-Cy5]|uniref:nucleotidyltransferase family protein n=1 Tax=Thermoleptolyngbya sichuanensis TaxID=2885951 RepID=UPI00240D39E4|nr:nucleotidyltransferase domain-containing protein [Thermoleptolyngbya sichuanensis]MDG2616150.1 nucleotidyltransferase domain-containing protein [Thermoleptolyngbya sichuanensis XZ-Cy5]
MTSSPLLPDRIAPALAANLTYIKLDRAKLADFCQKHRIRKLSLFGSILRDDFYPDRSDVDFLVEFLPEARIGYFEIVRIENELSTMIGRKADLRTPQELSRYFRQEVIDEAVTQYART